MQNPSPEAPILFTFTFDGTTATLHGADEDGDMCAAVTDEDGSSATVFGKSLLEIVKALTEHMAGRVRAKSLTRWQANRFKYCITQLICKYQVA